MIRATSRPRPQRAEGRSRFPLARPLPVASAGPRQGTYPPTFRCPATVPTWQPARQLGKRLRGSMQLLGQLVKNLRGGMQIFMKTLPPPQLSSLPWCCMPRWPGRVSERGGAATDGTGLVAIPNKATGHLRGAFNAPCPVMTGDKLRHCIPFHLLCATVATPFAYKRRPKAPREGFGSFGQVTPRS